ncbi:restriction endonuclease subunit S [uncultured Chryseobacterium sp.]|uniref:restriction endonuclease subunit S n=1 Tax=uncultured Chryseobacterium sp. TaxID=259322 RepID=UPI0025DED819|nr:restriction endonuclease subunit S [uncultured Chryseobacterium sp.]
MVKENTMKQTEIGLLPEDWNVVNLNEVSKISSSKRIFESDYVPYGIPFYRGKEISLLMQNKTIDEPFYISEAKYFSLANKYGYPKYGDLLITAVGTLGNIYCIGNDEKFYFKDGNLIWINNVIQNSKFLKIALDYNKQQILDNAIGSSQKALTINSLSITKIPLPPLSEQKAIAEALSDADAWIESLEQLIAKKRLIKQGAMQELLTPKEDWEVKNIKEITNNIIDYRGVTPKKLGMEWGNGNIVALSAGNVKKGYIDFNSECYFGSEELYKRWMRNGNPKKNDIVFTLEAPLGNVALLPNNDKYILSQRTILLQLSEKFNPNFIFQILLSNKFQNYILESATGSTAQGIKRQVFEKLLVTVPKSLTEQTRIATILSDMDAELEALEGQLRKARKVKQGMMQGLLTGRVRLV